MILILIRSLIRQRFYFSVVHWLALQIPANGPITGMLRDVSGPKNYYKTLSKIM